MGIFLNVFNGICHEIGFFSVFLVHGATLVQPGHLAIHKTKVKAVGAHSFAAMSIAHSIWAQRKNERTKEEQEGKMQQVNVLSAMHN